MPWRLFTRGTGYAPGWLLRCPVCGSCKPAAAAGIIRIGASSPFGKPVLGFCRRCARMRMLTMFKDEGRDRLWSELAAYVAEGSMDAALARQIHLADADEDRKREIAALIAEGLDADEGLSLLSLPARR